MREKNYWNVVKLAERTPLETYMDWEGMADPTEALKAVEARSYVLSSIDEELKRAIIDIAAHTVHEEVDQGNSDDAYDENYIYGVLRGIEVALGSRYIMKSVTESLEPLGVAQELARLLHYGLAGIAETPKEGMEHFEAPEPLGGTEGYSMEVVFKGERFRIELAPEEN
jgi:hypothetical protein